MRLFELTNPPAKTKTITFTFGRMNPPTVGHGKLIQKVIDTASGDDFVIIPTKTQDKKKNPLSFEQKVHFLNEMFPLIEGHVALDSNIRTVFDAMKAFDAAGVKQVTMVVGSDRVGQFEKLLNSYNGKEYNFDAINIVSAGQRDPDADGVEGMSASKMREAAQNDDYESFQQGLPQGFDGQELFQAVRQGMGLTEDAEHTCKTCGGEGVVYWDYDDPEVEATVKASAPCPDCSVQEDADNKEADRYRNWGLQGKFIYSGWG